MFQDLASDSLNCDGNLGASQSQCACIYPHSLAAFAIFLRLPGFAEYLLKDRKKAVCMLRLALGVTDSGDGSEYIKQFLRKILKKF